MTNCCKYEKKFRFSHKTEKSFDQSVKSNLHFYEEFCFADLLYETLSSTPIRGELSYLAPLGSENISAPYFKQCFFQGGEALPPIQSNTTPPSPKTEITNILFYILNFASIIKFKMQRFFNILPQQETKTKDYGTLPSIKIPIYIH